LRRASGCRPRSRATWAIGRSDSKTRRAPRSSSSGGYFLGRGMGLEGLLFSRVIVLVREPLGNSGRLTLGRSSHSERRGQAVFGLGFEDVALEGGGARIARHFCEAVRLENRPLSDLRLPGLVLRRRSGGPAHELLVGKRLSRARRGVAGVKQRNQPLERGHRHAVAPPAVGVPNGSGLLLRRRGRSGWRRRTLRGRRAV